MTHMYNASEILLTNPALSGVHVNIVIYSYINLVVVIC